MEVVIPVYQVRAVMVLWKEQVYHNMSLETSGLKNTY